jgi:YbbR domain-containing protein
VKWLINNLPFKILSLILSMILWLYVAGELERGLWWRDREVTFINIPIKILDSKESEFKVDINPDKANIVLLYSYKSNLESIDREDIILFVDLGNLKSGTYELPVQNIPINDFTVKKIDPTKVKVVIQERRVEPISPPVSQSGQNLQE